MLGLAGFCLLLFVYFDLLWTTFLEGGGPLTMRTCDIVGRATVAIRCRVKSRSVMQYAGLLAVAATVALWITLVWIAWSLVFNASRGAVLNTATGRPATWFSRAYFAGTTIFTLGLGDYHPGGRAWQLLTDLAAGNGFLMFGLALAYIVPVVSAATQKRQVAICIWSLGKSPDDIIVRAWNGADATALSPHLVSLIPMLALLGESHLTYPVLHLFHATKRRGSLAPGVATLDEAISILECGLQQGCSLDLPSLGAAREAINSFLDTLKPALIFPARDVPPLPSLQPLREKGVMTADDDVFAEAFATLAERRRLLLALVRHEGWDWSDVWPTGAAATEAAVVGAMCPRPAKRPP